MMEMEKQTSGLLPILGLERIRVVEKVMSEPSQTSRLSDTRRTTTNLDMVIALCYFFFQRSVNNDSRC